VTTILEFIGVISAGIPKSFVRHIWLKFYTLGNVTKEQKMDPVQPSEAALIIEQTGQTFPLSRDLITIGRKTGNTIVLADDLKVSRHHATIKRETGTFIIQDVGSANGTFLNDERMGGPQPLNDGDVIRVGSTTLSVTLPRDETEPSLKLAEAGADERVNTAPPPTDRPPRMTDTEPSVVTNPYVGPRTFTQVEGDRFFGREQEARELHSLIISERLVLFYAQSGAGKSSLLNTRVVPQLQGAGLAVLPIGRVGGELPEGITGVENIFVFNLLLSLDESDGDPNRFTRMYLSEFLTRLTSQDGMHYYYDEAAASVADDETIEAAPYVLIVDQFEEIITNHPARWQEREGFFRQLAQAMADDPMLWVVLTLREDFVAALDPYTHLLPETLRARFYMQRMGHEAALEAIKKPADRFSRPFAPGVAENLVDNLRQIRVHDPQSRDLDGTRPGQFVEPVQLQVACFQLWENLLKQNQPPGQITQQNLDELGDVDQALAQFYEEAVLEVVLRTRVTEIYLRNWFQDQLITEAGTKGMVYRGRTKTGGIPNEAVDVLVAKFLLRAEVKSGGTWYELVHDRFIEPILQSNREWREEQPLIRVAQNWADSGRPASSLLQGEQLKEVLGSTNWHALGPLVRPKKKQTGRSGKGNNSASWNRSELWPQSDSDVSRQSPSWAAWR
jgi:pSer/pThr/pTyr-binding forkhead associated (FHA) protein